MKHGFIKVAACGIKTRVADTTANTGEVLRSIEEADRAGVQLLVFPEMTLTGYTCGDLFYAHALLDSVIQGIETIKAFTNNREVICIVGAPLIHMSKLYNCAVVIQNGSILGVVPKTYLPNYNEFYEMRQITSATQLSKDAMITLCDDTIPFGADLIFAHDSMADYTFGIELCEDLWAAVPPCERLCRNGAMIIANLSASNETVGKEGYRRMLVTSTAARLLSGYIYCSSGMGESTQDLVFSSHRMIAENGTILAESKPFIDESGMTISEIDVQRLSGERHKNTSFVPGNDSCRRVIFHQSIRETKLTREWAQHPFVPGNPATLAERAETILQIQANGLRKRIEHTRAKCVVIGISGGLDSTLALLVAARAMDLLGRPRTDIIGVTMPCFGTTKRTHSNAIDLCDSIGTTLREVNITDAVNIHFRDIGQDPSVTDVTFENCQARERTQVIMDIANHDGGFVVGTGDLSELALGWATYNGDHMSMYGVNTSVPKTLVRFIVRYEAERSGGKLQTVLEDILDTPVSPELQPVDKAGNMTQITEDLVGPYELHDFYLYYTLRFAYAPDKIYRLACRSFEGVYDKATIMKWLRTFVWRFFAQQFKRSCMPDGPKVGSAALSPRGDWRMPSDAVSAEWLKTLDEIKVN